MSRKLFSEEELSILRQNPYVYSVTGTRLTLTKEFKEIFMTSYKAEGLPSHGFDINILGGTPCLEYLAAYSRRIQEVR